VNHGALQESELAGQVQSATEAAARAAAAEATLESQAATLRHQLESLGKEHASHAASRHFLEQQLGRQAQLEQQASQRVHELAQLGQQLDQQQLPPGAAPPAVPLQQFRELQMEMRMLHDRFSHLQHLHTHNLEAMQRHGAEAHASAARAHELGQRLQVAEAKLQQALASASASAAANATSVPSEPPTLSASEAAARAQQLTQAASAALGSAGAGLSDGLSAIGGSLLQGFGKRVENVKQLSKELVGDLTGVTAGRSDVPTGGPTNSQDPRGA